MCYSGALSYVNRERLIGSLVYVFLYYLIPITRTCILGVVCYLIVFKYKVKKRRVATLLVLLPEEAVYEWSAYGREE